MLSSMKKSSGIFTVTTPKTFPLPPPEQHPPNSTKASPTPASTPPYPTQEPLGLQTSLLSHVATNPFLTTATTPPSGQPVIHAPTLKIKGGLLDLRTFPDLEELQIYSKMTSRNQRPSQWLSRNKLK
ncbi:hypothetical protein NQD34_001489 [Periophthalmus magnuspinnatus]|nr:hypothetical protein NQD34_001489 [Periophthalmus magnuspinnatus]